MTTGLDSSSPLGTSYFLQRNLEHSRNVHPRLKGSWLNQCFRERPRGYAGTLKDEMLEERIATSQIIIGAGTLTPGFWIVWRKDRAG